MGRTGRDLPDFVSDNISVTLPLWQGSRQDSKLAAAQEPLGRRPERAAPMVGGMASATVLTLIVVPAIYGLWKGWGLPAGRKAAADDQNEKSTGTAP